MINVFVDSSIFISEKYNFYSGTLVYLTRRIELGLVNLLSSHIVIEEVKRHINDDCNNVADRIKSMLGMPAPNEFFGTEFSITRLKEKLLNDFDDYLRSATIIPFDCVSIKRLFDDYFRETPPFEKGKKKSEFPDAVNVQLINEYARHCESKVCVISKDADISKAFSTNDMICVYNTTKEFLTSIPKDEMMRSACVNCINKQNDDVESNLLLLLNDTDWTDIVESMNTCIDTEGVEAEEISIIRIKQCGLSLIDVENGRAIANMSAEAKIKINYDYEDHSNEWHDEGDVYGTKTGYAEGELCVHIEFEVEMYFEVNDEGYDCEINRYCFVDIDRHNVRGSVLTEETDDDYF